MSFGNPLLLLTLLMLPIAAAVYLWLERRPARYALTYTNVDVLAPVVRGRSWRRYVAPLLALARARRALRRGRAAAPHDARPLRPGDGRARHRRLGLDARDRREAEPSRRRAGGDPEFLKRCRRT